MEKDILVKAMALNKEVRVYILNATDVLNEAIKTHDTWPSASSSMGKILTMGLLLGGMLKGDEALTIKYDCNGPIGAIIVDSNSKGEVRGYVEHPHVNFLNNNGGLNDLATVGDNGYLDVIKDLKLKDLFTSSIVATGNISNDFAQYFKESEQTLSLIALGTLIDTNNLSLINGGIIIQLLPNASDNTIDYIEDRVKTIRSISSTLKDNSEDEILKMLFEDNFEILSKSKVCFNCDCSKERFKRGLFTLTVDDLEEMVKENKSIETICHYCNKEYSFDVNELEEILELKRNANKKSL